MSISRRDFLAGAGAVAVGAMRRADALARFRSEFEGSIILPGDAGYDRARATASVNPHTDKRPRLIARCLHAADVARAIEFARTQSLEMAVRAGGHDLLGASVCDGGIVIDVSRMKSIVVDGDRRTARVEAGVRSSELNAATSPYGLAAVLGCNPAVGFFDANWRDAARAEAAMAWVDNSWSAMQPFSSAGTYVNYLSGGRDEAVRAAYQGNYQRLVALKRRYDPSNVFHLNETSALEAVVTAWTRGDRKSSRGARRRPSIRGKIAKRG